MCSEFVGKMWARCGHGIIQVYVWNAGVKLIKWASGERDASFLSEAGTALTYAITETSIGKVTA